MDLIDVRSLSKYNDGCSWLFLAIDSFSKYCWVKPMRTKSAKTTVGAIRRLVEDDLSGKQIESMFMDHGSEFVNILVKNYLQSKNIRMDLALSETKAAIAERMNRTLQVIAAATAATTTINFIVFISCFIIHTH